MNLIIQINNNMQIMKKKSIYQTFVVKKLTSNLSKIYLMQAHT